LSKKEKKKKKKKTEAEVKLPGPMRIILGALAAYYLRDIIHPAFTFIAVMILMMLPVLIADKLFPSKKVK